MAVTRDEVHRLVDAVPVDALPSIDAYLREYTSSPRRSIERQLTDAGLLEELGSLGGDLPDSAAVRTARQHAGRGRSLSDYVTENR